MKLEFHILQNFAPSCLNRDDTGSPKDCEFGGIRRARISSQCYKRAIRQAFKEHNLLAEHELTDRTKRLAIEVAGRVAASKTVDTKLALDVTQRTIEGAGLGFAKRAKEEDDLKTEYLLFMPRRSIQAIADLISRHWDTLLAFHEAAVGTAAPVADKKEDGAKAKAKTAKQKKNEAQASFPTELRDQIQALLADRRRAPELALFGRMIADKPEWNTDAACQVAHALSTNRATMEFDFYTAVDDLKPSDTAGADMMGTIQFNSACFYRYAVLDLDELAKNLGGAQKDDPEIRALAKRSMEAFLRASVVAIPTGKQNSMAAHNPPGFVLAILRDSGAPWSLANAFLKPVSPSLHEKQSDLMTRSIEALDKHLGDLARMYGTKGIQQVTFCALDQAAGKDLAELGAKGSRLGGKLVDDVEQLIQGVSAAAYGAA